MFGWLFGKKPVKKPEPKGPVFKVGDSNCTHLVMVPRWNRVEDIGDESKAFGYHCYACGQSLSLGEAEEARLQWEEKLKD